MLPADVEAWLRQSNGPIAFDADGTLWHGDVGDELVRELGHFEEYEARVREDPIAGYAWAGELVEGRDVSALCERLFEKQRIFDFVKPALARAREVYVVSASPRVAVLPGARALGIDPERVIAVTSERPIPCGDGKVLHLKRRGLKPAVAFGNGELDEPMLRYAERAVVVAPRDGPDNGLVRAAQRNGWPILRA